MFLKMFQRHVQRSIKVKKYFFKNFIVVLLLSFVIFIVIFMNMTTNTTTTTTMDTLVTRTILGIQDFLKPHYCKDRFRWNLIMQGPPVLYMSSITWCNFCHSFAKMYKRPCLVYFWHSFAQMYKRPCDSVGICFLFSDFLQLGLPEKVESD